MKTIEMADSSQQDKSAVAAVRAGDAERYRELVERHERRVYALAWSRLGNAALAEDVAQEAFIRAYRGLWLLGDGASFSGWVAAITRRVAINFGLRHRRELKKRERWALEQVSETAPEKPVEESEPLHSPETLRQTLAELPAAHRECPVLFYLEGKSGPEAAAALGISEAALRVRLHRARVALREQLEKKLEGSLEQLRPAHTLVPAVMAGVMGSSSAKAATAGGLGAAISGILAKIGLTKWLLPLGSLFSFIALLPVLGVSWLMARLELSNFRDQEGFRARLFRSQIKSRMLFVLVAILVGFLLIPFLISHVNLGLPSRPKSSLFFLLLAGFCFLCTPFPLRQTVINRNRFFLASIAGQILVGIALLLVGLDVLPFKEVMLCFLGQALLTVPFYSQRPIRMDYNLFLRASEDLLPALEPSINNAPYSKAELVSFARFLGTRWLANNHRWSDAGLTLRLVPVEFSQFTGWVDLMFNWSFRNRSQVRLGWKGEVTARLGLRDERALAKLREKAPLPRTEWERQVAMAVAGAWEKFEAQDFASAASAIGEVAESDVFVVPPAKGGLARARWLFAALFALCLIPVFGVHLRGCQQQMAKLDGIYPVSITAAQVHEFMSLVSTNPNPLVETNLDGRRIFTQKGFEWDPGMALFTCLVLPETNLFTPHGLQMMRSTIFPGANSQDPDMETRMKLGLCMTPLAKRALVARWIGWQDMILSSDLVYQELQAYGNRHQIEFQYEYLLANASAWSWVQRQRWEVKRAGEGTLNQLRWLRAVDCLDLVDTNSLIQQIASVQTLSAHPPGNPPIHDWKDVRGLFFTPCFPALQHTYFSVAALEILGGLEKIDREACIEGILRVHRGKGFFTSPDSGGYNEYHIDGSAQDTIAAYEALRILGALDRVKDLDQWQFRTRRRHLAKDQVTWSEIEAWVAQQRLHKAVAARKESPSTTFRSLLLP